jgi:AcrR family transcriptional regulator
VRKAAQAHIPAAPRVRRGHGLAPRKRPTQERARETVGAILQAAIDLFAAEGHARTSTNRIAERAGVSIGSLYQYFPGKDAILAALYDRHTAMIEASIADALALFTAPDVPLERSLRRLLEGLCAMHDGEPKLTRAVSVQPPHVPRLETSLRKQEHVQAVQVEALLRARPDVRAGDRAVMAQVLLQAIEALTRWLGHDVPAHLDRRVAIDEVVRMLTRYLAP